MGELLLTWAGWSLVLVCSVVGVLVSLLSFTGAWLISLSAVLLILMRTDGEPGWWVAGGFLVASAALELFDFFAGNLGIARRGGSSAAGWAALAGGLVGMVAGAWIPMPVLGSLIGLLAGSFLCAYAVERRRLNHTGQAAHIARGAVWARLLVMMTKTVAALGMSGYLWFLLLTA